ncbi:hypothetical protein MCC93_16550 [Morococcus cerebrosus]|jgi:hypothetical protein|uniref:Uncharacterized protein n=1 Tax=Morococcus cerebrosus TaxID=1056807 RepID=A0A0C1GYR8_9NEIS|nr:hypothetical protein MCC93_16550 [Morococcus cerebrosus]
MIKELIVWTLHISDNFRRPFNLYSVAVMMSRQEMAADNVFNVCLN